MKNIAAFVLSTLLLFGIFGCMSETSGTQTPSAKPSQTQTATPKVEPTPKDYEQIGFELMESESLGQLKLNITESLLKNKIGSPDKKSKAEVWGADGLEHSTWTYSKLGLVIDMQKEPGSKVESLVYSITATAPCSFATLRGIKIGDKKETVLTAYKNEINEEMTTQESIVIGSVYGGIIIGIQNGRVQSIFIGAGAE